MNILNYRNAKYVASDNNTVDLEVLTDTYGWIPITINLLDSDTEAHIVDIKNWIASNSTLISAYVTPPPPPVVIPTEVTSAQAKIALSRLGYLTQVETALNALTGVQKTEALIAWNSSNHVTRTSQLVIAMQASLGLTATQMDDLFTLANSINP